MTKHSFILRSSQFIFVLGLSALLSIAENLLPKGFVWLVWFGGLSLVVSFSVVIEYLLRIVKNVLS